MSDFSLNRPTLTVYEWRDRPLLGTTATTNPANAHQTTPGQQISLGGFSGLFFEGTAANGNLQFITHTDRGPNGEPTDLIPAVPGNERPFALPNFQPELVRFELDRTTGQISIIERIGLKRKDGIALTGLPNLQSGANGTAYTDEVPVDLFGNRLPNDSLGADLEGIVVAADGSFWMVDEYRPAIYHFDRTGALIDRFIPQGSATSGSKFGTATLPAVYAQRRVNRGFEAVALEGTKLYAFIQSAIDNPDSTGDTTSRNSRNLRILEFDTVTQTVTGEYLYLLDDISGSGNAKTDKIGDAVSLGNGKFLVIERDDRSGTDSNKLIYEIDLSGATNIGNTAALSGIPSEKTIEQLSETELSSANIQPVGKHLVTNAATLGYTDVEKPEGLAVTDEGAVVLLNDNDFGLQVSPLTGDGTVSINPDPTPVKLGIIESKTSIRFSQFNASLNRGNAGDLVRDLSTPDNAQAKAVAEIIQRTNPDVLLINEFDYVAENPLEPVNLFKQNYLAIAQNGANPVDYPYVYIAPSNTGIASGLDLDNNGSVVTTPGAPGYGNDAFGFGNFPGQFGMLLLSQYPIDTANVRTFQNFLWKDMPNSLLPTVLTPGSTTPFYSSEEQALLRLSSKSHWDVPIQVNGETIHVLASHPTPPVFDGAEDRNGKRNHDEIRFWSDYITPSKGGYIYDDAGKIGGLNTGTPFVIMGDQNADPNDGDSFDNAVRQLLDNQFINTSTAPTSAGGSDAADRQGGANATHRSDPQFDTADFADTTPGNLRADYVLPSRNLKIEDAQVFWPTQDDPLFRLVGNFNPALPGGFPSSDHRLIWADLEPLKAGETQPVLPVVETPSILDDEDALKAKQPLNILLVNDDGYEATGIDALYKALTEAGHRVTLVAPKNQQSGRGTALDTSRIFRPIEVVNYAENKWYVDSTPVVTTLAGLDSILQDNPPDLVISGINEGENIGLSAVSSGTLSAAVAAVQRGVPAIAVSAGIQLSEQRQGYPSTDFAYAVGAKYVVDAIAQLQSTQADGEAILPTGVGLNINIPANGVVEGVSYTGFDNATSLGFRFGQLPPSFGEGQSLLIAPQSLAIGQVAKPASEGEQFLANRITVTPIDGNWSAADSVRETVENRVKDTPIPTTVTPLDILLVNDDGYQAEGIAEMYKALIAAGHRVTIVAPKLQQSGQGTAINADKIFRPIEVVEYAEDQWYVDGTPIVTTLAGLDSILKDNPPDLVISGINEGENVGLSAVSSGTLSAAVAAVQRGVPAIAVSAGINLSEQAQGFPSTKQAYKVGAEYVVDLIAQLQFTQGNSTSILPSGTGLNVNIPTGQPTEVAFTEFDQATSLGFRFGTLPPNFGTGQSLLIVPGTPVANPNSISEGEQFLAGRITVTAFDGDWGSQVENRQLIGNELSQTLLGDADDPGIWLHPTDSQQSLVVTALKNGGLAVFDLDGTLVQDLTTRPYSDIRYNNVDILYNFKLGGQTVDLAIATDRRNDTLTIWTIDPTTRQLTNVTSPALRAASASIFGVDDGAQTAYGIATYTDAAGLSYVYVSQRENNKIAQLELTANADGTIGATTVRTLSAPIPPGRTLEDAQFEGMVVDKELGFLYAGQEQRGIWKFKADKNADRAGTLIDIVKPEGQNLEEDVEGLTIYYGKDGKGYLLASSQGDNTYAVYNREGNNNYIGSFTIGRNGDVDSVEESDGADVLNVPLGSQYSFGLLVTQDGNNDPTVLDDENENINTNFKFTPWESIATAFPEPLLIDPTSSNPRNLKPRSAPTDPETPAELPNQVASGDTTQTSTVLWARSNGTGNVRFKYSTLADFSQIAGTQTVAVTDPLQPAKVQVTGLTPNTTYFYRAIDSSGASAAGRFNTSAPVGTRTGLRFGASGDWRGELSPYPAIANADDRNLEFFIELGDTVYADFPSPALNKPQAETLQEFRIKNNEVYAERFGINTWGDLRSATSILATIDDHEVINDFEGGELASADPRFNDTTPGRLINDTELYDNGLQAFQEYNPLRDDFYGAIGDSRMDGERKLYRYNTYGSDAATFVLDARSFRDEGLPAVANPGDPTQVVNFLGQSFNPSRTMLGRQQVSDLKRDLLQAEQAGISWKFVVVPEPIQNLGVVAASDRFEGYAAERTEILKFIDENDISNVVFIAADIHSTLVNNLTYQNGLGQPQIATSAFEITTGAVAFDAPFGPTVAELAAGLGLLPAAQKAFYDSLPVANDADSTPNDKDDFIKQLTNAQLTPLGYDPLGLNDNLAIANNKIDAKLLQGDYLSTHTYGWTEFDIDPVTQKLTVTTYGIPFYTEAELLADPGAIANRTPTIVSQFEVKPTLLGTKENDTIIAFQDSNDVVKAQDGNDDIFGLSGDDRLQGDEGNDNLSGGNGNDNLTGGSGRDLLVGGQGDDTLLGDNGRDELLGRAGNDTLRGGIGRDVIQGGRGADIFVLAIGEGRDTIADFDLEEGDRLGLADGLTFDQLTITQGQGSRTGDTLIRATGSNELLAIVLDVEASVLGRSVFTAV